MLSPRPTRPLFSSLSAEQEVRSRKGGRRNINFLNTLPSFTSSYNLSLHFAYLKGEAKPTERIACIKSNYYNHRSDVKVA
jgi:hypothetical protein